MTKLDELRQLTLNFTSSSITARHSVGARIKFLSRFANIDLLVQ